MCFEIFLSIQLLHYRADGQLGLDALVDYETLGAGDYYLLARDSGKETVLEPYSYSVDGVNESAKETGAAALDMQTAAGELSRESETLQSEVKKFLTNVRAS